MVSLIPYCCILRWSYDSNFWRGSCFNVLRIQNFLKASEEDMAIVFLGKKNHDEIECSITLLNIHYQKISCVQYESLKLKHDKNVFHLCWIFYFSLVPIKLYDMFEKSIEKILACMRQQRSNKEIITCLCETNSND